MATLARMTFDLNGNLLQITVPDKDAQLKDVSFSRKSAVSFNVPLRAYLACSTPLAVLQALQPFVTNANAAAGAKLQTIITAMQQQDSGATVDASSDAVQVSA